MPHQKANEFQLYSALQKAMNRKIRHQQHIEDLLPPIDVDFAPYFETILPKGEPVLEDIRRRDMGLHYQNLKNAAGGFPEIIALHMLLISYLRRDTEHSARAFSLFHRLWEEYLYELLEIIPTRDLISGLRAFADHPKNTEQRLAAKIAFTYAHMIKIYESERQAEGGKLRKARYSVPGGCPKIAIADLWGVHLGGDNSFEIINVLIAEEVEQVETIGPMILTLLTRIQNGGTVFSRHDYARLGSNYKVKSENEWSFGFNPKVDQNSISLFSKS